MSKTTEKVFEAVAPVIQRMGYELCDVEIGKEGKDKILYIYIDKQGGVDLNDCEAVTQEIDPMIDALDPIAENYYLCVSSPGLDRPIKKPRDFLRNIGNEVEVGLYQSVDKKKKFEGILSAFDEQSHQITLQCGDKEYQFTLDQVSIVKPLIRF